MTCPNCAAAEARATAAEAVANEPCANCGFPTEDIIGKPKLTERLAAAEGERDAWRDRHERLQAAYHGLVRERATLDSCERAVRGERDTLHAALAEARGREKALREALERLYDVNVGLNMNGLPGALTEARAALALPCSTEGRPTKELQNQGAVAPGLKSEEGK